MKSLLTIMALTASMAAHATENNDTTVITNAKRVMIVTTDTAQTIQVTGGEGNADYSNGKTVPLNEYKMRRMRREKEKKESCWYADLDLGIGVNTPLSTSEGYGFATFRSWELFFGPRICYTPKNALQTYSFGLWIDMKNYGLGTKMQMRTDGNHVVGLYDYPVGTDKGSSSINIFSLSVPLLFTQKLGRQSKWSFTLGPVVNFNVRGRLNNYYEIGDDEVDVSIKNLKYKVVTIDLMASVCYRHLSFYCKYAPMDVFKKDKGPEFKSLTFGLYF